MPLVAALAPLYVFALSVFVGFEVISKVPVVLHTPLMSGSNAIHGVVLVGAMLVAGAADNWFFMVLGFLGVVCGTVNVVGGFMVTDRMLQMFRKKTSPAAGAKP
jgi:NAD(P) transhydrogenase subunit alpha